MTASTSRQAAPAGSRRFWLTVAAFALTNALVWVGYHHHQTSRTAGLLRIERFSHADGGTVAPRPRLAWTFNLDVAPPADGKAVGTIAPAVPGRWHWPNARTLAFEPADELPKATRFTVTIPAGQLVTPGGFQLDKPFTSTFQTAPVGLASAKQSGFDGDRPIIDLTFDDVVLPADVMRHLTLKGPDGKTLACEPHGEAAGTVVRVRTAPLPPTPPGAEDRSVRVTLSPGLAGRGGPLATAAPIETSVAVGSDLAATDVTATADGEGGAGIRVDFNRGDLDLASVKQVLRVDPAVPFTVSGSYSGIELAGDFRPGTRYAVKILPPPAGGDRAKFPRPATLSVFVPDHAPSVWFEHDAGYLGSRGSRTLLAHALNAFDLTVRVTRVYDNNLVQWRTSAAAGTGRSWRGGSSSSVDELAAPVAEKRIRLPQKKNEKQDVRISLDELLPATASRDGAYRVHLAATPSTSAGNGDGDDDFNFGRYSRYGLGGGADASCVVTLSDLGLTAKTGRGHATAWVTSLSGGAPLPGVRVRVFSDKNQPLGEALSGADGLAHVKLVEPSDGERPTVVLADRPAGAGNDTPGAQLTWLDLRSAAVSYGDADTGGRPYLRDGYEAFLYTDRGVYRPGETVHLRALVRGVDNATPAPFPVTFQLVRPDLRDWRAETTTLDADGAAGLELALPTDLPTGKWTAKVGLPGTSGGDASKWFGTVSFQVEEFMPDRMKVELAVGGKGDGTAIARLPLGDAPLKADVQADYLFGRPVANRPATLVARVEPSTFAPAGWAGWSFGDAAGTSGPLGVAAPLGRRTELPVATLNAAGHAGWDVNVRELIASGDPVDKSAGVAAPADESSAYAGPWTLTTTTSVTEDGGRAVSASRRAEVDLVPYYVGLHRPAKLVRPKTPCTFDLALVTPAGTAIAAADADGAMLTATLYRETWNNSLVQENGRYRYESTRVLEPVEAEDAATLAVDGGRGTCTAVAPAAGSYVLRVTDEQTGAAASVAFYAGTDSWDDQINREDPERLDVVVLPPGGADAYLDAARRFDVRAFGQLIRNALTPSTAPNTDESGQLRFRVGERPRVLVRSPFKGQLLLTVETDSVVWSRVVDMPASQVTVPIELPEECRPNAYVTASVVRAIDPNAKWRAHRATGVARLLVDNAERRLNVEIAAPTEIRPATTLDAAVRVTDAAGRPAADVAVTVAAVDEGICRLTDFTTPDPFGFFTGDRALATETADLYGQLMPEVPKPGKTSSPGGDDDSRYRSPVAAKRVKPVALFSGVVRTGADGVARVSFPVPQFAGQLRLMAVAYAGAAEAEAEAAATSFGSAELPVTVRSPLIVQSSWPRFAAPGDRFTVPLVAFNNATLSGDVEVKLEIVPGGTGDATLKFADGDGVRTTRTLRIAPGGQASADVGVVALDRAGVARVRTVATLGGETFEESIELPVRPASPALTTGGYEVATPEQPATVNVPDDVLSGTGELRLNVTPWPSLELPEGLEYLDRYPYGCAEQTVSTLFPLAYLGDLGERVSPHLFDRARIAEKVQAGIIRLIGMRTADGGIGMWPGERASWPWASVYAAHFLVEARVAGHEIPDDLYDGLLAYARGLLNKPGDAADVLEVQAYACYVLALSGKPERAAMSRLGEVLGGPVVSAAAPAADGNAALPPHARFHLAAGWLAAGRRDLAESLIPKVLPAPCAKRQQAGNVGSPVRDQAVMLATLVAVQPNRPDVPAMAQALADAGRKGRWQSTQDTAFAVVALGRYLKAASNGVPYTGVELWRSGERLAAAKAGEPLRWDAGSSGTSAPLEVRVSGPTGARAHVSWLRTGVAQRPPADADSGMKVRRRYLDEHGKPLADGAVRSGDLVRVELSVNAPSAMANVVVEDFLPAGLEIENPRLATTATTDDAGRTLVPRRSDNEPAAPTFDVRRLDMRDDRLILAGNLSAGGTATYVYTARAVAPGAFVVPPVRAECMYDIGTCSIAAGGGTLRVTQVGKAGLADAAHE